MKIFFYLPQLRRPLCKCSNPLHLVKSLFTQGPLALFQEVDGIEQRPSFPWSSDPFPSPNFRVPILFRLANWTETTESDPSQ